MLNKFSAYKKEVEEEIKRTRDRYKSLKNAGSDTSAQKALDDLSDKYKKVYEGVKKVKRDMAVFEGESTYEYKNMYKERINPESSSAQSWSGIDFRTEKGTEVKGVNGATTMEDMKKRLDKIKSNVFGVVGATGISETSNQAEYNLNRMSFFWKKMDFREVYIGSPMAQLEFLFYMMMCYDSRDVHPTYDTESENIFGLDAGDHATGHIQNGNDGVRFAGPTMRLPDEYRALAKYMMRDGDERKYLLKYGIPFGERIRPNVNESYSRDEGRHNVVWYDANGDAVYPDIQFDVGVDGRAAAGAGLGRDTPGGQIAGIIQYFNLSGDGTDGVNDPGTAGGEYPVIGGHTNQNLGNYFAPNTRLDTLDAPENRNITLSMRGLNRRGFDQHVPAGGVAAAGASGARTYRSPFLPTLTEDTEHTKQHIHVVTNKKGYNIFSEANSGPANGGNVNVGARPGLNSIQNRYILGGAGNTFNYSGSFTGYTGANAVDATTAVKRGAIFGAYFGEPCLEDNCLQVTVSGGAKKSSNAGIVGQNGAPDNQAICNLYLNRFRTPVSDGGTHDDRRTGERDSNAGYVFKKKKIFIGDNDNNVFGSTNSGVLESWNNPRNGLAHGNGFIGNERGIGTTTYTTSRLSLLYDIVYSNPFGATNPTGNASRGYVDLMHQKHRTDTLNEGDAPGHICTPRDFYVKCVLGRYVMFWNQDGQPANDCWDQEYFPAPGCVKQVFGIANSGGEYVKDIENPINNEVLACTADRALPKVVHYAGRKVPKFTSGYAFTERGEGNDAYCDYDEAENRGQRNAAFAYARSATGGAGFTGGIIDFQIGKAVVNPPAVDNDNNRNIVRTSGDIAKGQGNLKFKDAQKTILTNFFCGNFSTVNQGTDAWDQIYQKVENSGLAQFDAGYKTNPYLQTSGHTAGALPADYLKINDNNDPVYGKITLAAQANIGVAGGATLEYQNESTVNSTICYNKCSGNNGADNGLAGANAVGDQYLPVDGVSPFKKYQANSQAGIILDQNNGSTVGFLSYDTGTHMPNGVGAASGALAGYTTSYSGDLKREGYCRYDLPGSQVSNGTQGAMFNAYRGLFSPTNIPTNVEIYAFCRNFARMIYGNIDGDKYPQLSGSSTDIATDRKNWANRMATKMAASICKIRELIFTDNLEGSELVDDLGIVPTPEAYASGDMNRNPFGLTSVNDGLPGGGWKKLLFKGGEGVHFNGIISNPNLQQAIKNIINKMIVARGDGFSKFPRNLNYSDDDLMRRAVRFNSEGMLRKNGALRVRDNTAAGARVIDYTNKDKLRPVKEYLPHDCGRCDLLATIDMTELYKCNLYMTGVSANGVQKEMTLIEYLQARLAENSGYIAKADVATWVNEAPYGQPSAAGVNYNVPRYGGLYNAPALGGIVQQYDQDGRKTSYWTVKKIAKYFRDLLGFWEEMLARIQGSIGQATIQWDEERVREQQDNMRQIMRLLKEFNDSLALGDNERIEQDKEVIELSFTQHIDGVREKNKAIDNSINKLKAMRNRIQEIRLRAIKNQKTTKTFLHSEVIRSEVKSVMEDAQAEKSKLEELRFEKRLYLQRVNEYFRVIDDELGAAENRGVTGANAKKIRDEILTLKKKLNNMATETLGASWREGIQQGFSVMDQLASKPEMAKKVADLKKYSDTLKQDFGGGLWIPVTYKKRLSKNVALVNILDGTVIPDWDDKKKRNEFGGQFGQLIVTGRDLKNEWYYMYPPEGDFPPKKSEISSLDYEVLKAFNLRLFTAYRSMQSSAMRSEAGMLRFQSSTGVSRAIWWATDGVKCGPDSIGDCPSKEQCAENAFDPASPCGGVTTMEEALNVIRRTVVSDSRFEKSKMVTRLTTMSGGRGRGSGRSGKGRGGKGRGRGRVRGSKRVTHLKSGLIEQMMQQFDL